MHQSFSIFLPSYPENLGNMFTIVKHVFQPLMDSIYPKLCISCGAGISSHDVVICESCFYRLPKTNFHFQPDNALEKVFWGRIPLFSAASYLYFRKKGMTQRILHAFKYKGVKEIGQDIGKVYGKLLSQSDRFNTIDYIIPVPLHREKLLKRGYNQSEWFGIGLQESSQMKLLPNSLIRTENTASQTRKNRFQRWENVETVFEIKNPEILSNKHVLLVDDIITTGATIEACAGVLMASGISKLSLACIATPVK